MSRPNPLTISALIDCYPTNIPWAGDLCEQALAETDLARSLSKCISLRFAQGRPWLEPVVVRQETSPLVEVASLDEVPLRSVWRDEARDFTPWLAEHPELLGRELQMDLELEGKEVAVGSFSADVVLRDTNTGQRVVVENWLETTDHDHLGKLITYAAALEARWAVLVAKEFRPEHRSALTWLNSISGEGSGFFGIEVHAVRIADSPTAVRLDMVVKPDDFSRRARAEAKQCPRRQGVTSSGGLSSFPSSTQRTQVGVTLRNRRTPTG